MTDVEPTPDKHDGQLVDIWSRPGPWARQRAYMFLSINACVYAALNVFVFWLRNGRMADFSWQSYAATYHQTLIDMLVFPLSVQDTPVLIPIVGMLLGVVIVVPILISQLYGFRYSIIFAAAVLFLAHLPVLSVFLVACSFIAGTSRHWLPFKFGVALLSLLPIALYFYVATRGAPALELKAIDPTLLYTPWVLAFLAAAGIAAAVLALAQLLKYRPGGILVSMIPFFAIPGVLFHHYIQVDQLEFRLLAHQTAPDRWAAMAPIDITPQVYLEAGKRWKQYQVRKLHQIAELAEHVYLPMVAYRLTAAHRGTIVQNCEKFEREYPGSRFIPNAMYIQAMAEDMRANHVLLFGEGRVKFHADLVSPVSAPLWRRLADEFPGSLYAQPARLRLAILTARAGRIADAIELLDDLAKRVDALLAVAQTQSVSPTGWRRLIARPRPAAIPPVDLAAVREQAEQLRELLSSNADDPKFGNDPLIELLRLDRRHPNWRRNLLDLAVTYAGGKLHDNVIVMSTLTQDDPRQVKVDLQRHVEHFRGRDVGVLALFELARITWELALVDNDQRAKVQARNLYRRLVQEYPRHSLTRRAEHELARLAELDRLGKAPTR